MPCRSGSPPAPAGGPEAELSLALQGDAFGVDPPEDDHVPQQRTQLRTVDVGDEGIQPRVRDATAVRIQDALRELQILGGVCDGVICGDIVVLLVLGGPREAPRTDASVITGMV